ncbi:MAG: hypothetical protein JW821_16855, partial [Deltaproteobacteria bacterium]|nr:hypothetical protein [Deltaproteobacteria bacterium]
MSGRFRRRDILCVALIVLGGPALFFRVLTSGETLFGSDFVLYFYPLKTFVRSCLETLGTVPLWNPYLFSGFPFIADIQASLFYPLGLFYYLMPAEQAYLYSTVCHVVLGGVFMYALMRTMDADPAGAFVSASIFSCNGYLMAHLYAGHLTLLQNYIWIPLIFCFLLRFLQTDSLKWAVGAGLFLGVQILGGFPQIGFYTILGVILLLCYHVVFRPRENRDRGTVRTLIGGLLVLVLGFALAAVQVLPTLEFAGLSMRAGGLDYRFATDDSLHPVELLAFVLPDLFGNVVDGTYWRSPEGWHFWETCGYVGVLPLCLLFTGASREGRQRWRPFFVFLLVLALFLALGRHNPLYPLIYRLPGFHNFRIPAQILFLYVFSIAVLTGMGVSRMLRDEWRVSRAQAFFLGALGFLYLGFLLSLHFFPTPFLFHLFKTFALSPGVQATFEGFHVRALITADRISLLFFLSLFLLLLRRRGRIGRGVFIVLIGGCLVVDLGLYGGQFLLPHVAGPEPDKATIASRLPRTPVQGRVVTLGDVFRANDGLSYLFPSVSGYNPLLLRRYADFIQASQGFPPDRELVRLGRIRDPRDRLLALLNVRQAVFGRRVEVVKGPSSYASLVGEAVMKPESEVLSFMRSAEFDPERMVVFEPEFGPG